MTAPKSLRTSGSGNPKMGFQDWGLIFAGLVVIDGRLLKGFNRQADIRPDEI